MDNNNNPQNNNENQNTTPAPNYADIPAQTPVTPDLNQGQPVPPIAPQPPYQQPIVQPQQPYQQPQQPYQQPPIQQTPQTPYNQPYVVPSPPSKTNSAFICGILSLVACFVCSGLLVPEILGIVAIVQANSAIKAGDPDPRYKTARIMGIIGLCLGIVVAIIVSIVYGVMIATATSSSY